MPVEIRHVLTGEVIETYDAETLRGAFLTEANLRNANLNGAFLNGANLRNANLNGADLQGADLRGADLSCSDMCGADLRNARLNEANLSHTDMTGADLTGANLNNANLSGAYLRSSHIQNTSLLYANLFGASIEWSSHELIAEILRRAAGCDVARRSLAGLVLVSRDWCWEDFDICLKDADLREWVLDTLLPYARGSERRYPKAVIRGIAKRAMELKEGADNGK